MGQVFHAIARGHDQFRRSSRRWLPFPSHSFPRILVNGKRERPNQHLSENDMSQSSPTGGAGAGRGAAMLEPLDLSKRFSELASAWKKETRLLSSMTDMILHPAYQQIIGLGRGALPLILEELARQPDYWFWALFAI